MTCFLFLLEKNLWLIEVALDTLLRSLGKFLILESYLCNLAVMWYDFIELYLVLLHDTYQVIVCQT